MRPVGYTTQFGRRWRVALVAASPLWALGSKRRLVAVQLRHSPQGCPTVYTIHTLNIHIAYVHVTLVYNTIAKGF
jgi:hypothetical protein